MFLKHLCLLKDLETMLVNTIYTVFEEIQVVETAAYLLQCVNKIAHQPAIKSCAEKKAVELRVLFVKECQKTRHEFDNFHQHPPLRINEPPYAGTALWIAALIANLKRMWIAVCDATNELQFADNVEVVYGELSEALYAFQNQKYQDWLDTLAKLDSSQLQQKLDIVSNIFCNR